MKFLILLVSTLAILVIGGFAYLAITDVPVQTTLVSQTIPNERFFNSN